jgi:hypothetical protein
MPEVIEAAIPTAQSPKDGYAGTMFAFNCSPLSCNNRASDFATNQFCLLADWTEAVRAARDFANGGGEPPPYCIVRVYRSPTASSALP